MCAARDKKQLLRLKTESTFRIQVLELSNLINHTNDEIDDL